MFFYDRPAHRVAEFHRLSNESIHKFAHAAPDRFRSIATVPLQDPDRATIELE